MAPTGGQFLAEARKMNGWGYGAAENPCRLSGSPGPSQVLGHLPDGSHRTNPGQPATDCSGLVYRALKRLGINWFSWSGSQWAACIHISAAQAIHTPGALAFQGYHGAQHVAILVGNGSWQVFEAPGHYHNPHAVAERSGAGRPWTAFGLIAVLNYGGTGTHQVHPQLKKGDVGQAVRELQHKLDIGAGQHIGVDGIFGAATEQGVLNIQRLFQLPQDGICGAKTWAAVDYCYAKAS